MYCLSLSAQRSLTDSRSSFLQSVDMSGKTRAQCNEELLERGFYKKQDASEEVPPGLADPPYRPKNVPASGSQAAPSEEL